MNQEITAGQVRLILETGKNFGVTSTRDALNKAFEAGLDLVEISRTTDVPVAKIMDFGKYKYEMQKKKAEAKKKQKVIEIKEIKLTPTIDKHDYDVKLKSARRFLEEGNKVKFTLRFRGRELSYQQQGVDVLQNIIQDLESLSKVEQMPKLEGKQMGMLLSAK